MQSLLKEIHDSISLVETNRTDNNLSKITKIISIFRLARMKIREYIKIKKS